MILNRRELLRRLFAVTGVLAGSRFALPASPNPRQQPLKSVAKRGRVVAVKDPRVFREENRLDGKIVQEMLGRGLVKFTGEPDPASAWANLFRPSERVGLKVNCIAGRGISSSVELTEAIVAGLLSAGVRAENIVIWDRTNRELARAGFRLNRNGSGVRCYGTDDTLAGYESELVYAGQVGSHFSRLLTRFCDALINVPVLKDHNVSGVTAALKNYYGAIDNPSRYHGNHCNPYLADLNASPVIRQKERLVVCDALRVQYHGGPSYRPQWIWPCAGLLIGQDPVAVDRIGHDWIEQRRAEEGLASLKNEGREPSWLWTAARYGLGIADSSAIELLGV